MVRVQSVSAVNSLSLCFSLAPKAAPDLVVVMVAAVFPPSVVVVAALAPFGGGEVCFCSLHMVVMIPFAPFGGGGCCLASLCWIDAALQTLLVVVVVAFCSL